MNKIIETENSVVVRIDNAFTSNAKHFFEPYISQTNQEERFFGSFKFQNQAEAKKILEEAVKIVVKKFEVEDTVFDGPYPKMVEDQYGLSLQANGKVSFYKSLDSKEKFATADDVEDAIFSLEIHLKPTTKDRTIFLRVARAIYQGQSDRFNDELFNDDDMPF